MAVWSLVIEAGKGQQDPLRAPVSWTQQIVGFTEILGRIPGRLTSTDQALAHKQLGMGTRKPARPMACLAAVDRSAGVESGVRSETVSELCHIGRLTEAVEALEVLVQTGPCISKSLLYVVLKKCVAKNDLLLGRRVHACMVRGGNQADSFLGFHLLRMYASHGRLQDAMGVFEVVGKPDAFTWSAIISSHVKHGQDKQAIRLYHRMRRSGVEPDGHVFVAALQACLRVSDLRSGQQAHADVLASGIDPDLLLGNCLVSMYAKCSSLEDAERVFDGLGQKDVVTWNAMIVGYSQQGRGLKALRLHSAMQEEGMAVPTRVTFLVLLQACASLGNLALEKGKNLHSQIRDRGLEADVVLANCLVKMYAKCGSLQDAQAV